MTTGTQWEVDQIVGRKETKLALLYNLVCLDEFGGARQDK